MKLKVLDSSSAGNCYILENETSALIIEAGVSFKKVQKALKFKTEKIVGILVSHIHGDHAGHIMEYIHNGIYTFVSREMAEEMDLINEYFVCVVDNRTFNDLGSEFYCSPFSLIHDVPCYGFQITHPEIGNLVFMTDTSYSPYKFKNINHWLVECNHSKKIINNRVLSGEMDESQAKRILNSHMSIETLKDLFSCNDMSMTEKIILMHTSESNSSIDLFKDEIAKQTGKETYVALPELEIDLNIDL